MKKLIIIIIIVAALSFIGCNQEGDLKLNADGTYTGIGSVETREYDITGFNAINLNNDFVGKVVKGDTFSVKVTTNNDVFDLLVLEESAGILTAKVKEDIVLKETMYKIEITLPELENVTLRNDSILTSKNTFEADNFSVQTFSDTKLDISIWTSKLDVESSSDSHVKISGTSKEIIVIAKSDALVDLSKMVGETADINLKNDSMCIINVSGEVNLVSESSPTLKMVSGTLNPISVDEDTIIED